MESQWQSGWVCSVFGVSRLAQRIPVDANSAWHSVPQLMGQIRGRWGHGKIHLFARDLMQGHVSRDNREVKALLL